MSFLLLLLALAPDVLADGPKSAYTDLTHCTVVWKHEETSATQNISSLGPKAEWRVRSEGGTDVPFALITRVRWISESPKAKGEVLVTSRPSRRASHPCEAARHVESPSCPGGSRWPRSI